MTDSASKRLMELVTRAGLNPNSLATAAGYSSRSGVQRYFEDEGEFLSAKFVMKILHVLEGRGHPPITRDEVLSLGKGLSGLPKSAGDVSKDSLADEFIAVRRTLPVFGMSEGGEAGAFELNGVIADYVYCPAELEGVPDAYAIYMVGESMVPRYEPGETLYVHPHRPARPGNYVNIQVMKAGSDQKLAFVKRFVRRDNGTWTFKQLNPEKEIQFAASEVVSVHKIILSGDH